MTPVLRSFRFLFLLCFGSACLSLTLVSLRILPPIAALFLWTVVLAGFAALLGARRSKTRSVPRIRLMSTLAIVSLMAGCFGGTGHHGYGGGGGGGQNPFFALVFSNPTSSITLVAGSGATISFVIVNNGNSPSSGTTTVTFALTNGVTYDSTVSNGAGWDCSASTSTNVSCAPVASIQPGAAYALTLTVGLKAATGATGFPTTPTIVNAGNSASGGQSYTLNVTVQAAANPAPSATALSPNSTTAGGLNPLPLSVIGSNFVISISVVQWTIGGVTTPFTPDPTTSTSSQLNVSIPASYLAASGIANVTVMTPAPGGGTSSPALAFTINAPQPAISGLSPSSAIVGGGAFTLTVAGTGFIANSVVKWHGTALTTADVSGTSLAAQVPASDIASGTSASVTVFNPAPPTGGLTSTPATFTINSANPTPAIGSISPNNVPAGYGAFTLTVSGSNFVAGAVVLWGNAPLAATVHSSVLITASVPAADVATPASVMVTVKNPPPPTGGLTSNATTFTINTMGTASVKIKQPANPLVVLHVGQSLSLFVGIVAPTGSCASGGNDVNWLVDGTPGTSSNPGGMMTTATASGAAATYTAPQSPPLNGGFASITAVCASTPSITSAAVTVLIVTGNNSVFSGQLAYELNGFQASAFPFAIIGSLTADGSGGLTKVFQDASASNGVGVTIPPAHVAMTGWYAMDTQTHGYVQMFETANPANFEDFTIELNPSGIALSFLFGSLVQIDGPGGNVGSGVFTRVNPNGFSFAKFNGTYLTELAGTNSAGNTSAGVIGLFTVTETDATHAMISGGDAYDTTGAHGNGTGTMTIDDPTVGHGLATLNFTGNVNAVSFYIVGPRRAYVLVQGSSASVVESGGFAFQPPGQTFSGLSGLQSVFAAIGINSSAGHASAIAGVLTIGQHGAVNAEYDANDGGVVPSTAPGTFTAKASINLNGQGSIGTFSAGAPVQSVVFYLKNTAGAGVFLEQPATPGGATEGRIGYLSPLTLPTTGPFADSDFDGLTLVGDTQVETARSPNGLAIATFHGTTSPTFSGIGDASAVGFAPGINGIIAGQVHFTDATNGRGTLTTSTNTFFGSTNSAFYAFDPFGDLVAVPQDTTDPQLIFVGP